MRTFKAIVLVFALAMIVTAGINLVTVQRVTIPVNAGSGFVFEGCWAYFPAGQCYDIYRDGAGNYWICKSCGQTRNPGPKVCRQISAETLASGYWCS